jgi:hypothetical protein
MGFAVIVVLIVYVTIHISFCYNFMRFYTLLLYYNIIYKIWILIFEKYFKIVLCCPLSDNFFFLLRPSWFLELLFLFNGGDMCDRQAAGQLQLGGGQETAGCSYADCVGSSQSLGEWIAHSFMTRYQSLSGQMQALID